MRKIYCTFISSIIIVVLLTGCSPAATTTIVVPTATQELPSSTPQPSATPIPPTNTPIPLPTATATPLVFSAADQPIKIQNYSILITFNGLIDIGYNPSGGSTTTALNFSIIEESGKLEEVLTLGALITDSKGNYIENSFSESGKNIKGEFTLTYNILTTEKTGEYYLAFPSGEMIHLTPLIK